MSLHAHMSDNARNSQKDEVVNFPEEGPESCAPELSFQINGTCKTHPHAWRAITLVRNPAERLTRSSSQLRRSSHEKIVQPRYDFQIVVRSGAMIKETDGISVGELQPTRYQIGHNAPRSYK
jgi:hypothetical protein